MFEFYGREVLREREGAVRGCSICELRKIPRELTATWLCESTETERTICQLQRLSNWQRHQIRRLSRLRVEGGLFVSSYCSGVWRAHHDDCSSAW